MIKDELLNKHHQEVVDAVNEVFVFAQGHEKMPGDFLLFLNNGHTSKLKSDVHSDKMIGFGHRGISDNDRTEFFLFCHKYMKFEELYHSIKYESKKKEEDTKEYVYKNSLHLDLMLYTHAWESYPNLSRLKHLANLCNASDYDWDIEIPDFTRHEFIRKRIRDVFKSNGLKIADIMTRSYHSQLRNAFAHSDYDFFKTNCISLNNYKGEPHEIAEITYEQWDERFTLSMLLFNQVSAHISKFKKEIGEETAGKPIEVWVPDKQGVLIKDHLWYDAYFNRYLWEYQREETDPKSK